MNDVFNAVPATGITLNWPDKGGPFVLTVSDAEDAIAFFSGIQLRVKTKLALSRRVAGGRAKFSTDCPMLDGASRKIIGVEATADRSIDASSIDQVQLTSTTLTFPTVPVTFNESDGFIRFGVTYCTDTVGASAGDMDMTISA